MTSDSSSSDEASVPITKPLVDQLSALFLSDADGLENGVVYETPRWNNHSEIENEDDAAALTDSAPPEESSDGGGGIEWARTNLEVEADAPESPSSSGYAGGRGSSSASSDGSGIDDCGGEG